MKRHDGYAAGEYQTRKCTVWKECSCWM